MHSGTTEQFFFSNVQTKVTNECGLHHRGKHYELLEKDIPSAVSALQVVLTVIKRLIGKKAAGSSSSSGRSERSRSPTPEENSMLYKIAGRLLQNKQMSYLGEGGYNDE